jgi:hypothetical protein
MCIVWTEPLNVVSTISRARARVCSVVVPPGSGGAARAGQAITSPDLTIISGDVTKCAPRAPPRRASTPPPSANEQPSPRRATRACNTRPCWRKRGVAAGGVGCCGLCALDRAMLDTLPLSMSSLTLTNRRCGSSRRTCCCCCCCCCCCGLRRLLPAAAPAAAYGPPSLHSARSPSRSPAALAPCMVPCAAGLARLGHA